MRRHRPPGYNEQQSPPPHPAATGDELEDGRPFAIVAAAGSPGYLPPHPGGPQIPQTNGWAPFGHGQGVHDQIGAYDGPPLNQYPAIVPGVQLHSAVEFLNSRYYFPARSVIPNGSTQQTQIGSMQPGYQRTGSRFTGPIGPVMATLFRKRAVDASVSQSAAIVGVTDWRLLTAQDAE